MDKKGYDPLQEEFRSSQVYNVLKGSGIPVAGKIADGLDKATQGLDQVVGGFASGGNSTSRGAQTGHPYQASPKQAGYQVPPKQTPPQNGWNQQAQTNTANYRPPQGAYQNNGKQTGNGYYQYNYAQQNQTRPPQQNQRQASPGSRLPRCSSLGPRRSGPSRPGNLPRASRGRGARPVRHRRRHTSRPGETEPRRELLYPRCP